MVPSLTIALQLAALLVPATILFTALYYQAGSTVLSVRLLIWVLWTTILMALTALLSTRIEVLTTSFAITAALAMTWGLLPCILGPRTLAWWNRRRPRETLLFAFALLLSSASGFVLVYNLVSDHPQFLALLSVALGAFLLPQMLITSYDLWMSVPPKRYKTWVFPVHSDVPRLQPIEPIKLVMNFTPSPSGLNGPFENYEVEFPTNESLSNLFHYFITFHNKHREYKKKPIQYLTGDLPLEWVLYKYSPQRKKCYLDMDKTLIQNQVYPNDQIYATSLEPTPVY